MFHKKQFLPLPCIYHTFIIDRPKNVRFQIKSVSVKEVVAVHALKSTIRKSQTPNIKLNKNILFSVFCFFIV